MNQQDTLCPRKSTGDSGIHRLESSVLTQHLLPLYLQALLPKPTNTTEHTRCLTLQSQRLVPRMLSTNEEGGH